MRRKREETKEEHGDVSLSIEETNKLRASLGLAPLKVTEEKTVTEEAVEEKQPDKKKADAATALESRVRESRRKRKQEELAQTKSLGAQGEDVDDVMAWVEKNRQVANTASIKNDKNVRSRRRKQDVLPMEDSLAGLDHAKVKHGLGGLEDEMVLTLADKSLLDEKGNLIEDEEIELENALVREDKEREKAYRASKKAKPLWEEDGMKRSLLDKYDEEEEEAMVLGQGGMISAENLKPKEDLKAKLLAAQSALAPPLKPVGGDYYTSDEIKAMEKPQGKKKKKERRLKKKALTSDDIDELEKAAELNMGELGSREQRVKRRKQNDESHIIDHMEQRAKFEAALRKANLASDALRDDNPEFEDDDDDGLGESLAKAREMALKKQKQNGEGSLDSLAETIIQRRGAMEKKSKDMNGVGLTFTTISEFARSVVVEDEEKDDIQKKKDDVIVSEDEDKEEIDHSEKTGTREMRKGKYRSHAVEVDDPGASREPSILDAEAPKDAKINRGLGGALSYLKETGELNRSIEWAGRTKDSRDAFFKKAMGDYKDVFTGGKEEDQIAADVEVALTRKDEYGRIMTPKEAYRQLCYKFHGIQPSKSTKEKRQKQVQKELAQKKAASGATGTGVVMGFQKIQEKSAMPFMVLSGTVKPGQTRDAGISKDVPMH